MREYGVRTLLSAMPIVLESLDEQVASDRTADYSTADYNCPACR